MRCGRLPLRIIAAVIFLFSFIFSLSSFILQRQSAALLQKAMDSETAFHNAERLRALNHVAEEQQLLQQQQRLAAAEAERRRGFDEFEEVGGRKKVAYVQQVSQLSAVCNSVMIFADLKTLGSRAQRVLYYPAAWGTEFASRDEDDEENDIRSRIRNMFSGGAATKQKQKKGWINQRKKIIVPKNRKVSLPKPKIMAAVPPAQQPPAAAVKLAKREEPRIPVFINENDPIAVATYETAKRLLIRAKTQYGVKLVAVENDDEEEGGTNSIGGMLSPLYLFNMTEYSRVIHLDPISMVLKNLDHLLRLAPGIDIAATRAYWLSSSQQKQGDEIQGANMGMESFTGYGMSSGLSPNLFVVKPSEFEYRRILAHISRTISNTNLLRKRNLQVEGEEAAAEGKENKPSSVVSRVLNELYQSTAMVLPQMPYELLSSEFRSNDTAHERYLGRRAYPYDGMGSGWDAAEALKGAYYVRFDGDEDGSGMPWEWRASEDDPAEPQCTSPPGNEPCADRDAWKGIYEMFAERRRNVCGLDLEPPKAT